MKPTPLSGTLGAYSMKRFSPARAGSVMFTRGKGRLGFGIGAKYLSTQASSCF